MIEQRQSTTSMGGAMRFFAYWLSILAGMAFLLAYAVVIVMFGRWVEAQTGSALIAAGSSLLFVSLFVAWLMTSDLVSKTIGRVLARQQARRG